MNRALSHYGLYTLAKALSFQKPSDIPIRVSIVV